jgi:GAF domain-containing protein
MAGRLRESHRKLEAEIAQKTRDLSALYATTMPIGHSATLARVLDDAVVKLLEVTAADGVAIQLLDGHDGRVAARGLTPLAPGDRLVGEALASERPVIVEDLLAADRADRWAPLIAQGFRTAVLLPLILPGRAIGWITLARRGAREVVWGHAALLSAIAHQVTATSRTRRLPHGRDRAGRPGRGRGVLRQGQRRWHRGRVPRQGLRPVSAAR